MQMPFRLYYPSDVDIIAMKLRYGRHFNKMIRKCLDAYVNGKDFVLDVPDNIDRYIRRPEKPIVITLVFDDKGDREVINYLSKIRPYARTDIIRTIIRISYNEFPSWMFRFSGDIEYRKKATTAKKKLVVSKSAEKPKAEKEVAETNVSVKPDSTVSHEPVKEKEERIDVKEKPDTAVSSPPKNDDKIETGYVPAATDNPESNSDDAFDIFSEMMGMGS